MVIGKSTKYDLNLQHTNLKEERYKLPDYIRRFINIVNDHVKIKSIAIKSEYILDLLIRKLKDYSRINKILELTYHTMTFIIS